MNVNLIMAEGEGPNEVLLEELSNKIASQVVTAHQHNIPILTGAKGDCLIKFIRCFERVTKALKWSDQDKMDKFSNYLTNAGEEFHYMLIDCAPDEAKPSNWDETKDSFLNHFMRGDYKSHLSKELRSRRKGENESMIVYITSVMTLCHDLDDRMSETQAISYCIDGLEPEVQAQLSILNPERLTDLMRYAKNIEVSQERRKSKKVNAINS